MHVGGSVLMVTGLSQDSIKHNINVALHCILNFDQMNINHDTINQWIKIDM